MLPVQLHSWLPLLVGLVQCCNLGTGIRRPGKRGARSVHLGTRARTQNNVGNMHRHRQTLFEIRLRQWANMAGGLVPFVATSHSQSRKSAAS